MRVYATDKPATWRTDDPQGLVNRLLAMGDDENGAVRYRRTYGMKGKTMLEKLQRGEYAKHQHFTNMQEAYLAIYPDGRLVQSGYMAGRIENDLKRLAERVETAI